MEGAPSAPRGAGTISPATAWLWMLALGLGFWLAVAESIHWLL